MIGTVLVGREAVEVGLVDAEGGIEHALAKLNELVADKKLPQGRLCNDYSYTYAPRIGSGR